MKTINELSKEVHQNAVDKGWWEDKESFNVAEKLMLIVSEVSEAMEADRKGKRADMFGYEYDLKLESGKKNKTNRFEFWIKDTFEDELADVAIRLFDLCDAMKIDLQKHIELKMEYNKNREYKHGGKKY